MAWVWFHKWGSPPHFYRVAGRLIPWMAVPAALLIAIGLYGGLALAPADRVQGEGFRIIYVHVPAAVVSMMAYMCMAAGAVAGLVWRMNAGFAMARAAAVPGASFTVLALATGSIWGRPMWGTWWEWDDPRLMSELLLLFLYLGYLGLGNAIEDRARADRASALLAIVGVVNIPVIHYSVVWWNSLHQGATILKLGRPSIAAEMAWPLYLCLLGFVCYFLAIWLMRARAELLRRERNARWMSEAGVLS